MIPRELAAVPWWRFDAWRLSSRMAALSLLMLLGVQLAGYAVIRNSIQNNARVQLDRQLSVGERIWQQLVEQQTSKLALNASVLGADSGFRAALVTAEKDTIDSALDSLRTRNGAKVAARLDIGFQALNIVNAAPADLLPVLAGLAPQLAQGRSAAAVMGGRPYQFLMVPLKAPVTVGYLVMGFELDPFVEEMHKISLLDATLVQRPATGEARVLSSSLPVPAAVATGPARGEVRIEGTPHLVHSIVLADTTGQQISVRLTGSLDQAIEPYSKLLLTLAALTAAGLLLFGLGSVWTARRVTRPLRSLARAADRLGRGDYDAPLEHTGRRDEIGELAKAFDHMRVNIAAQQGEIRLLAYWDRLTGLPNRVQFRDAVRAAIARADATRDHIAVLMLDLDRFKNVNDALGYASGDSLLKGVAARLQQAMQAQAPRRAGLAGAHAMHAGDLLARLGGDEFALLLPGTDARAATTLAEQLLLAFEAPLTLIDQAVDLSAGIGIACWPDHAADADALLSRAEVAMYAAKARTGGAQVYDPAIDTASALTLSLLSELRHALEHDELRLFLQPKIALGSGRATGAEALVRWQHPQRGLVPPMQFIPFAERTGFIRRITLWIFEETARHQARLQHLGVERVSINLSTRDLLDQELPDKLDTLLQRHGARAEAFCLEITESAIMDDPHRAEATLNRLAERGFKLSIDDYGTGYSSLAYLQRLPVNELKIDKAFVMAMVDETGAATIVRSTIELAHNLGLSVVAEGVENGAILEHLRQLHCDEAQGYHMSKPLPVAEFEAWMARWSALNPPSPPTP